MIELIIGLALGLVLKYGFEFPTLLCVLVSFCVAFAYFLIAYLYRKD